MRRVKVIFTSGVSENLEYHDWKIEHQIEGDWLEIYAVSGLREMLKLAVFNREAIIGVIGEK